MLSTLDMFSVGIGPSSSHTVGPMRAACAFVSSLVERDLLAKTARVHVTLYGSLAQTGLGHGTDRAALAGLEGKQPETVDPDDVLHDLDRCSDSGRLLLAGTKEIPFDRSDIEFDTWHAPRLHPNRMLFRALDADGHLIVEDVIYSIGGGFIAYEDELQSKVRGKGRGGSGNAGAGHNDDNADDNGVTVPFPFSSAAELIAICERERLSIADVVWRNEAAFRPEEETRVRLYSVWKTMRDCVRNGCTSTERTLPGGLHVPRRAATVYQRLKPRSADIFDGHTDRNMLLSRASDAEWVDLFALAVSEENAGGGRIVTAPTNGSAGIIPAVLHYYWWLVDGANPTGVVDFLLTAAAVGYLFKRNASISGAEVGCQGEVGSACSMAAAGLCAVLGGTPKQVENAAEIGIEHNLGLTCDPIGGLVQIPCIERNAMASNTAINAARMALLGNGSHIVSLDSAIRTMKETGLDMKSKYKETSRGGLAVNVTEC
ncbi:L-serine ammonia-lyase [Bifidobacterium sp. 82T24]|uniref:L-serine ammonia-lyase n=1 Tax=Bifidobacterium saimiriisciurei TaxID=2661627 RepID=A0ABX0CA40_9BIFI|nr:MULTISPECIES: L-serine ammonia-lyase [Bifidobacterium]MBW3088346.1 L-serine ammonia-lyase [Bifidobacterium pluvialisilvae]NEG97025.1 L-serine ammonia-lyase [Bifidobacterium sp. SMB2]NEH11992.1 L-serine ammonia-lyase [Bifidobacterium saimiriisciurei]